MFSAHPRLLLAAVALVVTAVYVFYVVFRRPQWVSRDALIAHTLNVILLCGGASASVLVLALVTQRIPPTPWEEIIYMSVVKFPHITDIYSRENLIRPPIYVSIYSPAYYAIYKAAVWGAGKSLVVGRWLSAAGLVFTGCLLALFLRKNSEARFRFMPPLIFLSMFPTLIWTGSFAKPEFLAVFFSLAGLLVYIESDRREGIVAAALLCAIALLTKPSVLTSTITIAVHLLWTRRYGRLLTFLSTIGAILIPVYLLLYVQTGGGFWVMTVVGNALRFLPRKILSYALDVFLANPLVVLGIAAAAVLVARVSGGDQRRNVLSIFFFVALVWFFISAGRPGSSYTYFLEGAAACAIVTSLLFSDLIASTDRQFFYFVSVSLILALTVNLWQVTIAIRPSPGAQAERTQIVRILSGLQTGPSDLILADPHYAYLTVAAGHNILVNDSAQYSSMVDNGVLSSDPVMDVIKKGRVPFLVLVKSLEEHSALGYGGRLWPREVIDYLKRHYRCESVLRWGLFDYPVIICRPD